MVEIMFSYHNNKLKINLSVRVLFDYTFILNNSNLIENRSFQQLRRRHFLIELFPLPLFQLSDSQFVIEPLTTYTLRIAVIPISLVPNSSSF